MKNGEPRKLEETQNAERRMKNGERRFFGTVFFILPSAPVRFFILRSSFCVSSAFCVSSVSLFRTLLRIMGVGNSYPNER